MSEIKTEKQAIDLRAVAKAHAEAHTKAALTLAETLFTIKFSSVRLGGKEIPLVTHWGHDDFHEYVEHELGLHGTTAENYVNVYDVLIVNEDIPRDSLPPSITKLIQLARVVKREGIKPKEWIKKAHEMTCCEFEAAVCEELSGRPSTAAWAFYMTNKDIKEVERGIKRAKEILGTRHNGETLARIVEEWSTLAESNRLRMLRKVS